VLFRVPAGAARSRAQRPEAAADQADGEILARWRSRGIINPQNTGITIDGDLVPMIQRGEAISLGLLVYDVEADKLVIVGFSPETDAVLLKFNIGTEKLSAAGEIK
jgi:hypothetical protein